MIAPVGWLPTPPFVDCGSGAEDLGAVEDLGATVVAAGPEDWAPVTAGPEDEAEVDLAPAAPEEFATPEGCELVPATPVGVAAPEACELVPMKKLTELLEKRPGLSLSPLSITPLTALLISSFAAPVVGIALRYERAEPVRVVCPFASTSNADARSAATSFVEIPDTEARAATIAGSVASAVSWASNSDCWKAW